MGEFIHPVGVARDAHGPAGVKATTLPGLFRQDITVQSYRGGAQFLNGGIVREMCAKACRMPCRTVGQVVLFCQHDILPAHPREVIGQRNAHDAAAYDDN